MIYYFRFIGGPKGQQMKDAEIENLIGLKPMDSVMFTSEDPEKVHIYRAVGQGENCLDWVDDDARSITLYYLGEFSRKLLEQDETIEFAWKIPIPAEVLAEA